MASNQQVMDFTELEGAVNGEGLEQITRLLANGMGLHSEWTGRGADGGRDLIFTFWSDTPLRTRIRWLVSCKDLVRSGRSVNEADIPSPETKMRQHQTRGYLVVTTTTVSTGAKALLDGLSQNGEWFSDVWDNARLTQWLLRPENDGLLKQFFPSSHAALIARQGHSADEIRWVLGRFELATAQNARTLLVPGIATPLPRNEVPHIEDTLEQGSPVLVSGDSGTGKSGIAHALCNPRMLPDRPVLLLDARRCASVRTLGDLQDLIGLSDSVLSGLRRIGTRTGCRLIIDQLDSTAGSPAGSALVELAGLAARTEGVEVVVLSRRRESAEASLLGQLTRNGFVELECGELSEDAARAALTQIGIVPSEEIVRLSKNLLNLSLVAQIKKERLGFDFGSVLDEVDLWSGFVRSLKSSEEHEELILAEAYRLAREALQSEDRTCLLRPPRSAHDRRLESWGVIVPDEGYQYRFKHDNLLDFLYAQDASNQGRMPRDVLAEIAEHRTRNVFAWMEKLYRASGSSHRIRFMREVLDV